MRSILSEDAGCARPMLCTGDGVIAGDGGCDVRGELPRFRNDRSRKSAAACSMAVIVSAGMSLYGWGSTSINGESSSYSDTKSRPRSAIILQS